MATSFKIRILLLVLALSFAATAFTLHLTFHRENVLRADGKEVEANLQKKEAFINDFLGDNKTFEALKTIHINRSFAEETIRDLRDGRNIFLFTYRDNEMLFWGSNRINPISDAGLKDGSSFIRYKTGYFEAIKKSEGNFSAVCYIPIQNRYPFENEYLTNTFHADLINSNRLDIASLNDSSVYSVRNLSSKYLFSVKQKAEGNGNFFSRYELLGWLLAFFTAFLFFNYLCSWLAAKGKIRSSIALFFVLFLAFRLLTLKFNWLGTHFELPIFNSEYFSSNFFFPTLGDFLINILSAAWFLFFCYRHRWSIKLSDGPISKQISYIIFPLLGVIVALIAVQFNDVFYSLLMNSDINFDVTNIINLDGLSWIGILLLCISVLNIYLLIDIALAIGASLSLTNLEKLSIFLCGIIVLLVFKIIQDDLNVLFLFFATIIFIRGWMVYVKNDEFNMGITVTTILIFAVIASTKLSDFQSEKELSQRKIVAKNLGSSTDSLAVNTFKQVEEQIVKDHDIVRIFKSGNAELLRNKLQKFYLDGYLSRYELSAFSYSSPKDTLNNEAGKPLKKFKSLVLSGSIKVSKYFYHVSNTFGYKNYFAILPITENGKIAGTLFLELKSKTFYNPDISPRVLKDGKVQANEAYKAYSFAFYKEGALIGQYGKYVYNLNNNDYLGKLKQYVFLEKNNYSHVVYQPNKQLLIIVSKQIPTYITQLASVSFLFLVLLAFAVFCVVLNWAWRNFAGQNNLLRNFRWSLLISSNRLLYKTRIQAALVAAVVTTLILVGFITYYSISLQYQDQQQQTVIESINKIAIGFEKKMFSSSEPEINEQAFNAFADFNAVDLSYYDIDGRLLFTTQPKIFEAELIAPRMNALAYVYLNNFQHSEYLNKNERVGLLSFISAYKPIRNNNNETVGYLAHPYYSYVHDFEERIGLFINTLVNVYALVFVGIGFFAVFVANQITAPLTLVQKSLSQTKIGRKNEPIIWKRNDEIGSLVREYNNMIAALEESATRLASSERETAWKEMAKQVAHEIKNPLTPLKLGVQLLDKSWRENDPNFNKKFEKFSKSFIEQIESLSHIASEFSNFAKMPETSLETVGLREVIDKSIEVYSKVENASVIMEDLVGQETMIKGDKDQLLRCFNNLIKNAIEAVPENRYGQIHILVDKRDRYAHIEISDNGKGIPEGLRDRIFNPNFTTKSSGTGLGLAFVKQAIGNMAGSIRFITEQDKGTTFYITLPLA